MSLTRTWLFAFVLTCLLELPIVVLATRSAESKWVRIVAVALLGQLLTHPLVWFGFPALTVLPAEGRFWSSELFAWLAEAALYAGLLRGVSIWRAIGVSGLANATSLAVGLVLVGD